MSDFLMPSLGADMEFGTLLEWRVKPGDAVKRGDIIAVVDTSKAEIEVEIFEDGVIGELLVPEGTRVPVGTALATVTAAPAAGAGAPPTSASHAEPAPPPRAESPPPAAAPTHAAAPARAQSAEAATPAAAGAIAAPPSQGSPPGPTEHRPRISPVARRTAERLGVDVSAIAGTGPGAAITKSDVERAAAVQGGDGAPSAAVPQSPAPTPQTGAPPPAESPTAPAPDRAAAMRQAIGALMARSKREIPHYYLQTEIDMTAALAWLTAENLRRSVGDRLIASALLLSAVARSASEMPAMNGFWVDGAFRPADSVHLGVAISLRGGGLIAPALRHADRMSLDELMTGLRDLVNRARAGRLRSSEMSDSTITVTNLGEQGADLVHGVIYPPQVALVGFGGIRERPWAAGGMVGSRVSVIATLAADHRASDGHSGDRMLKLVDRRLQTPEEL